MSAVYVLDTNIVSAVMADHPKVRARLATATGRIATAAVVRGEIRYGLERLPAGKRRTDLEAKAAIVFAALPIEPVTAAAGDVYGKTRCTVEQFGYNLNDNDLWIAATTLSLGAILVTNNQDFSHIPGLRIEDWTK